ncbi:MAG TPA: histidine kinase, partial [Chloroflexota bacterium]|nr:histidine kinase [Chloroflexota bacterium]
MTLRGKLIVTLAIILGLVGLQTAVTILFVTQAVEGSARLLGPAFSRVDNLAHLDADVLRLRSIEQSYLFNADAERPQHAAEMAVLLGNIENGIAVYRADPLDPTRAKIFARVVAEYHDYVDVHNQSMHAAETGDTSGAMRSFIAAQPRFDALENDLHQLRHQEYAATQDTNDQLVQAISRARLPLGAIFFVVAIVEAGLGWYVLRSTARSLNILAAGAQRIAREDFSQPVPAVPERELAVLGSALNHAMEELTSNQEARHRLEDERRRLLRDRLSQIVQAQEKERRRVSRDLHDQAGQALTALKYGLSRLQRLVPGAEAATEIDRLVTLANET